MVYVNVKKSSLDKYIGKQYSIEEIKEILYDIGMDVKGETLESDPELKVEITAEKLDLVSSIGIARAIQHYSGLKTKVPKYTCSISDKEVIVEKSVKNSRPKTVAMIVKNLPMTKELLDELIVIQEKIHDTFGRKRKKAAIGIYPIDKIKFPIYYRSVDPNQIKFRPLDFENEVTAQEILQKHETGKKFKHLLQGYNTYPIFQDDKSNILSMPPVINSHETGRVEESHTNLFVECSGYNITYLDSILKVLATIFIEYGGQIESMPVKYEGEDKYILNLEPSIQKVSLNYIRKIIGVDFKVEQIETLLNKMMYNLSKVEGDTLYVEVPCFKTDVWNDCDIADDIARGYGYNNIQLKYPEISTVGEKKPQTLFKDLVTKTLTQMGFLELYTYMLTQTNDQFSSMLVEDDDYIKLNDTAEEGINMVRVRVLPEILKSLHINRKNKYPQKVFENGFVIRNDKSQDVKAITKNNLAICIADPKTSYTSIKEIIDQLSRILGVKFSFHETQIPYFIEGRCAEIICNGNKVGEIGEIHPQVLENFGLIVSVVGLELNLDELNLN